MHPVIAGLIVFLLSEIYFAPHGISVQQKGIFLVVSMIFSALANILQTFHENKKRDNQWR